MTWRERIAAARIRGEFTEEDRDLAGSWSTCAVGEQRKMYPEIVLAVDSLKVPVPQDRKLYALGEGLPGGFCWYVSSNNIDRAEQCLDLIEDRILELKRETHNA